MNLFISKRRHVDEFKKKYKWMTTAVVLVFMMLMIRMVQLQLVQGEQWQRRAQSNMTKTIPLSSTRGIIEDTHGKIVAKNIPAYKVYMTPELISRNQSFDRIAELMNLSNKEKKKLRHDLDSVTRKRRMHQLEMFGNINRNQVAALRTHEAELNGVDVVDASERYYPNKHLAAHTIGYLNEVNPKDLEIFKAQKYKPGDVIGRMGVERAWEKVLRGKPGLIEERVDARGRVLRQTDASPELFTPRVVDPVPGKNIRLALDMKLIKIMDEVFRKQSSGSAVVVEVKTGKVRGLYSKPSYNLNEMSGKLTHKRFSKLNESPLRPLIDKTVYESYFPGSTFKPISALAALGDEVLDPQEKIDCPGFYELGNRKFRCTQAHGEVNMKQALVRSCNVYFWKLAERVGLDRLAHYARMFGLGKSTGIGINSEANGFVPTRQWHEKQTGKRFRLGFTLNVAIGQGNTRATLIQLAMAYAAIANGGNVLVPQLIENITDPLKTQSDHNHGDDLHFNGKYLDKDHLGEGQDSTNRFDPRHDKTSISENTQASEKNMTRDKAQVTIARKVAVKPEHFTLIVDSLIGVVNDEKGTAYAARSDSEWILAGKTGTAQVARHKPKEGEDPNLTWYLNRDHAWFAGFAPADDPQAAIVVLVEHGGSGGKTAAPIAVQIMDKYLDEISRAK